MGRGSLGFHQILSNYKITFPWWAESPSVLFFYGLLFFAFDKWAWKLFRKIGLLKTPDLNGEWKGHVKSSFNEHLAEIKATMTIFQSWTRIKILLVTEQSLSKSETASITVSVPEGKYLSYQYINEPRPEAVNTMSIHRGTARIFFNERENTFAGEYYSGRDRQNFGSLDLKRLTAHV